MEIAESMIAMKTAGTQSAIGVAVQRIGIEADRQVASLVAEVAQSAKGMTAPGVGQVLDRQA